MKYVKKILFALITFILGIILIYNVYNVISLKILKKDLATVNGYAILEVVSGSMEPTIHVGDIIVIDTKPEYFNVEDIITFYDKAGAFVTHRIVSINDKEMLTKGDNNNSQDEVTTTDKIVGKYVTKINGGGKLLAALRSPFTMIMILVIGILVCVLMSTDKDGEVILDEEEKEFQEFLKQKNELTEKKETSQQEKTEESKEPKKTSSSKKKTTQTNSKKKTTSSKKKTNNTKAKAKQKKK